jgi:hypothetical protein
MADFASTGRGRSALLGALALVVLLIGYADLWRGGTTISALCLAIGYAGLIPAALLSIGRAEWNADERRKDERFGDAPWLVAGAVALALFVLYVITLGPTTAMWDTSEYITAAKVFGVPHPPGNPVFVILGHAFGLLPLPIEYGARINLMAAVTSSLSAGLWFLVAEGVLRTWVPVKWGRYMGAAAAVIIGGTAFTVWNQSVVNEKVYTVALLGLASVSWLMLRWSDAPDRKGADRYLLTAAYLIGLGYANHPAGFLPLPAVGLLVLMRQPLALLRWRLLLTTFGMVLLGLTPMVAMPIRAAHEPYLNSGGVSACTDGIKFDCTFSKETWKRVKSHIDREQYSGHNWMERKAPITAQYGMFWLYFKWQWFRDAYNQASTMQSMLALLFLGLGLAGGWSHFQRDRRTFWYVGGLMFTLTIALVVYLNFKYGHSQAPELGNSVDREVRDRDYFYLWTFSLWGVWAGLGLVTLWTWMARALARSAEITDRGLRLAAPVLSLALIPLVTNAMDAPRNKHTFTREWARDLLNSVEPYGIIITNGDNDSFPLWYAQAVEGIRRDVTVAVVPYLGTDWYAQQLANRKIEPYDKEKGPALFRDRDWPMPTKPLFGLSRAELAAVPPIASLPSAQRFQFADIDVVIGNEYLTRDQQLVLYMIRSAYPERRLFFSYGGYAQALGFGDHIINFGLSQKLVGKRPDPSPLFMPLRGNELLDVAATESLWKEYRGMNALITEDGWVDDASAGIPIMYVITGQYLAGSFSAVGDSARADSIMTTVEQLVEKARLR